MTAVQLVDIHCHKPPAPEVVSIVATEPGDNLPETDRVSMGLHPWRLNDWRKRLEIIERAAAAGKLTAIGECGLDRVCSSHDFTTQLTIFEAQVELAVKYNLPIIIHCVRAIPETIAIKRAHPGVPAWILHGFNSKVQLLEDALQYDFFISFGQHAKPELLKQTPLAKMFLETDDSNSDIA
jgi:TatD DNase family protein